MKGHRTPVVIATNLQPTAEALRLQRLAKRMADDRQRLAMDRQAETDREAREASSAAVVGAVADVDGAKG